MTTSKGLTESILSSGLLQDARDLNQTDFLKRHENMFVCYMRHTHASMSYSLLQQ